MSHYITCHNCGEPECMDSDTGVHRRDDGTVCPDPRDAEVEGLRAEVERLKAEQAAAVCAWEEYARWPDLPSVPIGRVRLPDGREEEIALRPEQITGILRGIEKHVRACLPFGVEAVKARQDISDERVLREAAEAEVERLRAAAIPEDAEEIVFKELSIGVFEPQDLEIQEAIHAKRRAKASAVVKALRGQT